MMNRKIWALLICCSWLIGWGTSHAEIVHLDDFEYTADRLDPNIATVFQQHGWWYAKTEANDHGAKGYLYTTPTIDGYSGPFPGGNSSRVLAIEARPETFGGQTDFYLQYGSTVGTVDAIPGDVWIQFWLYPNYTVNEPSVLEEMKFLYACNGNYGCHTHLWMYLMRNHSNIPDRVPTAHPADMYFNTRDAEGPSVMTLDGLPSWDQGKLGQTDTSEFIAHNRWNLVKLHYNTTSTSGNSYEAWIRQYGGSWTKVAEWIGGVTPGFTWTIPAADVGGHTVMRMPTTVGSTSGGQDFWLYMDDFAMATTAADLPVYPDEVGALADPMPPSIVRD
ncbi:hypothetical protein N9089_04050 [Crocinitomicaceae bacterium]|nr:hypothetical protein [Crocinitomicaceae bacterium]